MNIALSSERLLTKSHSSNSEVVIALHSPDGGPQTGLPVRPLEKTAATLAFKVQSAVFSESGLNRKHAE
jgi:hypothetical protein